MSAFALREALEANDRERRRLTLLATALSERELGEVVHGRWTVAATLAHLAYWDRLALGLLERWAAGEPYETDGLPTWHDHAVNDALLDAALALPPSAAVRLALDAATGMDGRLRALGEEAARLLTERDASWLLRRHQHRAEHLDEVDGALGLRGC